MSVRQVDTTYLPTVRTPFAIPSRLKISMLRQLVISIFGHCVVVWFRSTSIHGTLLTVSCRAAINPPGPAPTTRTGVEWKGMIVVIWNVSYLG